MPDNRIEWWKIRGQVHDLCKLHEPARTNKIIALMQEIVESKDD